MKVSNKSYSNSKSKRIKRLREKAMQMNRVRWDKHKREIAAKIESGEIEIRTDHRPKKGDYLATIRIFNGLDGSVRDLVIRQSKRQNQITIDGCKRPHGWSWVTGKLREKLSVLTRWVDTP